MGGSGHDVHALHPVPASQMPACLVVSSLLSDSRRPFAHDKLPSTASPTAVCEGPAQACHVACTKLNIIVSEVDALRFKACVGGRKIRPDLYPSFSRQASSWNPDGKRHQIWGNEDGDVVVGCTVVDGHIVASDEAD